MKIINFFAEIIPVKGYSRSIIYDLPRLNFFLIPNTLHDLIKKYDRKDLKKIYSDLPDSKPIVDEYLSFLKEKELVFFTKTIQEAKLFPKLNLQWDYSAKISNAILIVNRNNIKDLSASISKLIEQNCYKLQFVSFELVDLEHWNWLLQELVNSPITSVEIYTKVDSNKDSSAFLQLAENHKRLKLLFFHSCERNEYVFEGDNGINIIYKSVQEITKGYSCGNVHPNYFNTNIGLFTESQHYNTCLNRKICIDENGEIKNCPAMSRSFGNIKDTTLEEALNKPGFKDLWGIRKDDIDVCKDCEFRYMCTDCRCFIKNPEDKYSQPAKCTYNPYQALWQGEEGFISVEQWRRQNPAWEKKAKRYPLVKVPQKVE